MSPDEPLLVARRLAHLAGAPAPTSVEPLAGGRNNRVYRVEHPDGPRVMKLYSADPRDDRDRLAHEWACLVYAWRRGVGMAPAPLAKDEARRAALYSHARGRILSAAEVGPRHMDAALDFILALNARPRQFEGIRSASDACFSLDDHIAATERRIARLQDLDETAPAREAAAALVREAVGPVWAKVRAEVEAGARRLGLDPSSPVQGQAMIFSPSDFGFHNALVDGDDVTFVDFEYAGLDDVAKLVGDVFAQPDAPLPAALFETFVERLMDGLQLRPVDLERCRLVRRVHQVKWACILLNDFLPVAAARRAFARQARTEESCRRQLDRASALLATIDRA
jgi:Ser/Thr protein kinase RdoA (MazF antagonist)